MLSRTESLGQLFKVQFENLSLKLGIVAHTCNSRTREANEEDVQELLISLGYRMRSCQNKKENQTKPNQTKPNQTKP
jgi:protein subunit release factor B